MNTTESNTMIKPFTSLEFDEFGQIQITFSELKKAKWTHIDTGLHLDMSDQSLSEYVGYTEWSSQVDTSSHLSLGWDWQFKKKPTKNIESSFRNIELIGDPFSNIHLIADQGVSIDHKFAQKLLFDILMNQPWKQEVLKLA